MKDGTSELSLTILSPSGKEYEEKAHDPFSMQGDQQTSPFQFQLGKITIRNKKNKISFIIFILFINRIFTR